MRIIGVVGAVLCCALASAATALGATNPDGSLVVNSSLQPLPPVATGAPIYDSIPRPGRRYAMFGVNDNLLATNPQQMTPVQVADAATAVGARFVRLDFFWPDLEPRDDDWQWAKFDAQYTAMVERGIRPMWLLQRTPNWAVGTDKSSCAGNAWNVTNLYCSAEPDPALRSELTEVGAKLAERYPLLAGLEYRNEPNMSAPANPTDGGGQCGANDQGGWFIDPEVYVENLRAFATGIRSERPDMRIWGGALTNCGGRIYPYVEAMLAAGAAQWMSALSWHPYDDYPGTTPYDQQLAEMHELLVSLGHPDLRLVAGEIGASLSHFGGNQTTVSTRLQARYSGIGPDATAASHRRYDAFVGFNLAAGALYVDSGYGWLGAKLLTRWPARRVFCDFRALLGVSTPLPSHIMNCLL